MLDPSRYPPIFPPPFASAWGDDQFGLWAEFSLSASTDHTPVTQRLRWVEPGTFRMGSPDDEQERNNDEGPRHQVTISQGFWLADTACSQALWKSIMGSNPSDSVSDPLRPAERVSWLEVQTFLRKLEILIPGIKADLPTEAEWEYACRAGTDTPFSFGVTITTDQINCDENYPHTIMNKGFYRAKTLPVKSLPPNAWGLYEMHGNVGEWCSDNPRNYDGQPQIDPAGKEVKGEISTKRAIRGGSWRYKANKSRSASRNALRVDDRSSYLGFRFCLRANEAS